MTFAILAFALILSLTFFLVSYVLRPTRLETEMDRRLDHIVGPSASSPEAAQTLDGFLAKTAGNRFPLLEEFLERTAIATKLTQLLLQAGSDRSLGEILIISCSLSLTAFVAALVLFQLFFLSASIAVAASYLPFGYLRLRRRRRLAAFDAVLPDTIEMCVRALRAGHAIVAAIGIIAEQAPEPAKSEFAEVHKKQTYGLSLRDALTQLLERVPSPDLRVVVAGIIVQREAGGNLADLLDRISVVLRKRAKVQGEIRTNTAQGRLTGWILCLLPVALLVVINLITPGYSAVLISNPLGRKMLYGGAALLIVGAFAISKIVNGIEV